jgi:cupin 2 domain-containing protein
MSIAKKNIFADIPDHLKDELIEIIGESANFRMERIVSHGQRSAEGFWYDQNENEFVILLKGSAVLRFENQPEPVSMKPGDYLHIEKHVRHRVDWTDPEQETVWLAVHVC